MSFFSSLYEINFQFHYMEGYDATVQVMQLRFAAALCLNFLPARSWAIELKLSGEWLVGFGAGTGQLYSHFREPGHGPRHKLDSNDIFEANQRLRLQMEAIASESLSGTVYIKIGDTRWGLAEQGGALGADSTEIIKVKNAYIDWAVPETELNVRMGIQGLALPNAAGGSAIMDADVAGVVANYKFNDAISASLTWMRPVNDNFTTK